MNVGGMGEYLGEWAEEQKKALVHNIVGWVVLEIWNWALWEKNLKKNEYMYMYGLP